MFNTSPNYDKYEGQNYGGILIDEDESEKAFINATIYEDLWKNKENLGGSI